MKTKLLIFKKFKRQSEQKYKDLLLGKLFSMREGGITCLKMYFESGNLYRTGTFRA